MKRGLSRLRALRESPRHALGVLTAAENVRAAAWLSPSAGDWGTIHSMVPAGFTAYARVFHPAWLGRQGVPGQFALTGGEEVRWADVAAANDRTMHGAAEWGQLTGSWQLGAQEGLWDEEPERGEAPERLTLRLASILAAHTGTPEACWFAVWDGWGEGPLATIRLFRDGTTEAERARAIEQSEEEQERLAQWGRCVRSAPTFQVPGRGYHLLRGSLSDIGRFYGRERNPPSVWWPEDRAWCVGGDVDLMTTYLGGTRAAIEAVTADPELEALPISAGQSVTWEADTINPSVGPPA